MQVKPFSFSHLAPSLRFSLMLLCCILAFGIVRGQGAVDSIPDLETFTSLQGKATSQKYGQVHSVKVVWDFPKAQVYFIDSDAYRWHYDFIRAELGYWRDRHTFNATNYSDSKSREFVLANVNRYPAQDLWALEFSTADDVPENLIREFYAVLEQRTFFGHELRVFLNTQRLEDAFEVGGDLPVVRPEEIYGGQQYQALVSGEAFGYLRKIKVSELDKRIPGPRDIVVLDGTPLDMPACAGVLTTALQTPLSHLNMLCQNRGTPFAADRKVWQSARVDSLEWDLVRLVVDKDGYRLELAELPEAEAWWARQGGSGRKVRLRRDLERKSLVELRDLNHRMVDVVGGKAANFGTLAKVARRSKGGFKVPEGAFAIPFYWYAEHLQRSGADSLLAALLKEPARRSDPRALDEALSGVRKAIRKAPLNPELYRLIEEQVRANGGYTRMRFRSSTNAEDIEGFNGAGLYTSRTGYVTDSATDKSVEDAVRKVWASAWSFRAFREREYFGLEQEAVAMGILVHRSFPSEQANGVAITRNIYRKSYHGFVVNVQQGEVSVVSPPEGVVCDQLICYSDSELDFFQEKDIVEYISHSSLTDGKSVLSREEVVHLTRELARIKKYWYWNVKGQSRKVRYEDYGLDVEFKLDGEDRQLYVKQVRLY